MKKSFLTLLLVLSSMLFASNALAAHFRGGTLSWSVPDPVGAPLTVKFRVLFACLNDGSLCRTSLFFGDGLNNGYVNGDATNLIGTGIDASGNSYNVHRYFVTHTYAATGTFSASYTDCCRVDVANTTNATAYSVRSVVSLVPGNNGGPITQGPPVLHLPVGGIATHLFPMLDPDLDAVTCRAATSAESGINQQPSFNGAVPVFTPTASGCLMTWDLSSATAANAGTQYAVQTMFESVHGGITSSSALDYLVEFVNPPPPACAGSGSFVVNVGQAFTTNLVGTVNPLTGGNVTVGSIGVPVGGSINPAAGSNVASPSTVTFSWTPQASDAGTASVALISFTDSLNHAGSCFVALYVPQCPNFGQACSVGVGACQASGQLVCSGNGTSVCNATAGTPVAETCNNIDDDCDGAVDDGNPQGNQTCNTGLPGVCGDGLTTCAAGGSLTCVGFVQPGTVTETCNGLDDNCDGSFDEGFGLGGTCTVGVGACQAPGVLECDGVGGVYCNGTPGTPTSETCNNIDDNCDGVVDEGNPGGGAGCSTGLFGACASGTTSCVAGATACIPTVTPGMQTEICGNAEDEDCDGAINNDCPDADGDGLPDYVEIGFGSDPDDADSDDDGVPDGQEAEPDQDADGDGLINILDPDSDNDGLFDGTELGLDCNGADTNANAGNCTPDADGGATTTDPLDPDSDGGGVSDGSEDANLNGAIDAGETDPTSGNGADDGQVVDSDGDGLSDVLEVALGTDPNDADSDDDGVPDGQEANPAADSDGDGIINALDVDSDNDGLFDGTELGFDCNGAGTDVNAGHCVPDGDAGATTTSPINPDSDGGGVSDGSEDANLNGAIDAGETDPTAGHGDDDLLNADDDNDGLSNDLEIFLGSDPNDADSDDDGVLDGNEANPSDDVDGDNKPNIVDEDADGDGLFDGTELGLDCSNGDTDLSKGNCIPDADNGATTTDPFNADTDGGSVPDGTEDANHNGTVDPGETDPNDGTDDLVEMPECAIDADCGAIDSGMVCDDTTMTCIEGCRGTDGNGCPEGMECTSTDSTIGQCLPIEEQPECTSDGECGAINSGLICEANVCVEGCRGLNGNGCPGTLVCSSTTEVAGTCGAAPLGEAESGVFPEGNGILCAASAPGDTCGSNDGVLALVALAGLVAVRRRRAA